MNWHIGDRAVIINSKFPERIGTHVTIESELLDISPLTGLPWQNGCPHHMVNIPSLAFPDLPAAYSPKSLAPIPDDRNQTTTWDQCDFKPAISKVLES